MCIKSSAYGKNLVFGCDPNMYDLVLLSNYEGPGHQSNAPPRGAEQGDFAGRDMGRGPSSELQAIYLPYCVEITLKAYRGHRAAIYVLPGPNVGRRPTIAL